MTAPLGPTSGATGGARIYRTEVTHVRRTPLRNEFRYRSRWWLVDVDRLPRVPRPLRALVAVRGRRPPRRPRAQPARERRAAPRGRGRRRRRRTDHPAHRPARARPRLQPAVGVLVPPPRRHPRRHARRGAQHLRRPARLHGAHRRARHRPHRQGLLRLPVPPGRRLVHDEPARAGRRPPPLGDAAPHRGSPLHRLGPRHRPTRHHRRGGPCRPHLAGGVAAHGGADPLAGRAAVAARPAGPAPARGGRDPPRQSRA